MQRNRLDLEADICNKLDQLGITMFGRRIHNPDPLQGKRVSYDIHPYTKQGTGVSCTITYTDAKTGIPYVLLSKKKNKDIYDQIGGYTRGQGPAGSEITYEKRTEDARDKDEEEIIGNIDAVKIPEGEADSVFTSNTAYSLGQLKDAAFIGFYQQMAIKLGKKINPTQMKETLLSKGINFKYDYNAWDTALREVKEETSLNLTDHKPKELYTADDFGISNNEQLHTKVTHYLFHFGTLTESPAVKAGSDVESLKWVPVTDIDLKSKKVKDDLPIRESYLLQTLPRALKKVREIELAKASNNMFVKYKSLGAYIFSDPFSAAACEYHKKLLTRAIIVNNLIKPQLEASETLEASRNTM